MDEHYDYEEKSLMDYLNVIWKRKWLIVIPTFCLIVLVGVYSFLLPRLWEVDAIILPSKFLVQTEQGGFSEVMVVDPKQVAGQINQGSYNNLIAAELNIDLRKLPKLKAENLRDTKLIRISVKEKDVSLSKSVLLSLFNHLKGEFDKKIDVEMKSIDTKVSSNENLIKLKELNIKDSLNEIKLQDIEITKAKQEILSAENKLKISEERVKSILDEMQTVKVRIDDIERQQKTMLTEKKEGGEAIGLLLYSNEIQNNLRYYNTLDEKLSTEKIGQENLNLFIKGKNEEIKQFITKIEKLRNDIDKIKNEMDDIKSQIKLLADKKARIDYSLLIKEPTSSFYPVSPKKRQNVMIAGILGLMMFAGLAFFIEYIENQKNKQNSEEKK